MATEYIRNSIGSPIGTMVTESNGNVRIYDNRFNFLGSYNKGNDMVLDERLNPVGRGIASLGLIIGRLR